MKQMTEVYKKIQALRPGYKGGLKEATIENSSSARP